MRTSHLLRSVVCLIPARAINAWVLDSTCNSIKEDITEGMQGAFAMADAGGRVFNTYPLDSDVQTLAGWLLGPNDARYNSVQGKYRYSRSQSTGLITVPDRLQSLAPTTQLTTNLLPGDDVVSQPGQVIIPFRLTRSLPGRRLRYGELGAL